MSTTVDNITLAILSLKQDLENYLDDNGWRRKYHIVLAGDPDLRRKEIVADTNINTKTQIGLPLITLETGSIRNEVQELGNNSGQDIITVSLLIMCLDDNQLRTLGNLIRRRLTDFNFDVYDYRYPRRKLIGSASLSETILDNISDWDSDIITNRHVVLINTQLELAAEEFI